MKSPAGGASTINGVLYQILNSLAKFGELHVFAPWQQDNDFTQVTLVLEPPDGGDHQVVSPLKRTVEQMKIRQGGEGTWSLKEVIQKILPDLYRAVDFSKIETDFKLVTDGRIGNWKEVLSFFASLDRINSTAEVSRVLADLDDSKPLKVGKKTQPIKKQPENPFWGSKTYSAKKLIDRIVESLSNVKEITDSEDVVAKKLIYLLSRIEFVWQKSFSQLEKSVDLWLLGLIPKREDLPNVKRALMTDLLEQARKGNHSVVAEELFERHKLTGLHLRYFNKICEKAKTRHRRTIGNKRISLEDDPRETVAKSIYERMLNNEPLVLLVGESGQGKSWLGYSIIEEAAKNHHLVLSITSQGCAKANYEVASRRLWQEIIENDGEVPFCNITKRLKENANKLSEHRVFLFIDGSVGLDEAYDIQDELWEDWNTSVIFSCFPQTQRIIQEMVNSNRVRFVEVPDFSINETRCYMGQSSELFDKLDDQVQDAIRRPFFANLFRELALDEEWHADIQFVLFDKYWNRLVSASKATPSDIANLKAAALAIFNGRQTIQTFEQLCSITSDAECPARLISSRWITRTIDGYYEFWHSRLLSWAIAVTIVEKVNDKSLNRSEVQSQLAKILNLESSDFLSVPRDAIWLATRNGDKQFGAEILIAAEEDKE